MPPAPQPASVEHWLSVVAKRHMVGARLGISAELDRELFAVSLLFAESMHKVRVRLWGGAAREKARPGACEARSAPRAAAARPAGKRRPFVPGTPRTSTQPSVSDPPPDKHARAHLPPQLLRARERLLQELVSRLSAMGDHPVAELMLGSHPDGAAAAAARARAASDAAASSMTCAAPLEAARAAGAPPSGAPSGDSTSGGVVTDLPGEAQEVLEQLEGSMQHQVGGLARPTRRRARAAACSQGGRGRTARCLARARHAARAPSWQCHAWGRRAHLLLLLLLLLLPLPQIALSQRAPPPPQPQAHLLATLHGAAALLTGRHPLLAAHGMVNTWPWLPDMVSMVQLSSQVCLPPIFFQSGIGLTPADVEEGHAKLESILRACRDALPIG
jgi:hypothetical protein